MREQFKAAAGQAKDPIADDIAKMFGDWGRLSVQHDAAAMIEGRTRE